MEVEPIRTSGATLTEALSAAQHQMATAPKAEVTPTKEKGSGFFARLLESVNAEPSWSEHPWQVGVNRRSMEVTATRWAKKQNAASAEILAPSSVTSGKSVQPASLTSAPSVQRTESVPLPSPAAAKPPVTENKSTVPEKTPAAAPATTPPSKKQTYGYGLEEVLPKELLEQSPLLQRTPEEQTPAKQTPASPTSGKSAPQTMSPTEAPSVENVEFESVPAPQLSEQHSKAADDGAASSQIESALLRLQSLLMARTYDEAAFFSALTGVYNGRNA